MIRFLMRNFARNKLYYSINIIGLVLGIASSTYIFLYLHSEMTFDQHFSESEDVYRVALNRVYPSNEVKWASIPAPVSNALKENFPEIEETARMCKGQINIYQDGRIFEESDVIYVDPDFFKIFQLPLLDGTVTTLDQPKQIVLTHNAALKYFNQTDVSGEFLRVNDSLSYTVAGVVEDLPQNTHFKASMFLPMQDSFEPFVANQWGSAFFFFTYIRLRDEINPIAFENKARSLLLDKMAQAEAGMDFQKWLDDGNSYDYYLQPLEDIHLQSNLQWEFMPNNNISTIRLFIAIGIFLVLITVVNYVNLTTARAGKRMKELGLRKILGASRTRLINQLLSESVVLTLFSAIVAFVLVGSLLDNFQDVSGKTFTLESLMTPAFLISFITSVLLLGILAGLYPSLKMSRVYPVKAITSGSKGSGEMAKDRWVRNVLVAIQFGISFTVIFSTLIVNRQNAYLSSVDLGYDKSNLLVVENARDLKGKHQEFKDEILKYPVFRTGYITSSTPGFIQGASSYSPPGGENDPVNMSVVTSDEDVLETLKLNLISGRDFRKTDYSDSLGHCLLNATAARRLGWSPEDASNQRLTNTNGGIPIKVVGVVEDFHIQSLREEIRPLIILLGDRGFGKVILRVNGDHNAAQEAVLATWDKFNTRKPVEYTYLDNQLQQLYISEKNTHELFTVSTFLAILIAAFGMYGLSAYLAEIKRKEVAIRKTLGASAALIMKYFTWKQLKVIVAALLIGVPISYYFGTDWLDNYAYRISIGLDLYLIAILALVVIGSISIVWHSGKAALENPVKALRE